MSPKDWINLGSAVVDIGSNIVSGVQNKKQFEHQKAVDAFNMDMANKNYQLAVDQMNWQQEAQQTAWSREDNAIRRRVADLEAAGMSKWQAAGQAAQSGGVTASNVTSAANMINSGARFNQNNFKNPVDTFLAGAERQAGISLTEKQQELIQAQIDNEKQDTVNKSFGVLKSVAETKQIYQDISNSIQNLELLKAQFEEQKKLWESQKNKNSAEADKLRENAKLLSVQAQTELSNLKLMGSYYEMAVEKHEDMLKNSKNQRFTNVFSEIRKGIRDISNVLTQWVPFGSGSGSSPIGFSLD